MRVKRSAYIEMVIKDVIRSKTSYEYSLNGTHIWSVYAGNKPYYKKYDPDAPGATMELNNGFSSTRVYLTDVDEIIETVINHNDRAFEIVDYAKKVGDYLSKPENADLRR